MNSGLQSISNLPQLSAQPLHHQFKHHWQCYFNAFGLHIRETSFLCLSLASTLTTVSVNIIFVFASASLFVCLGITIRSLRHRYSFASALPRLHCLFASASRTVRLPRLHCLFASAHVHGFVHCGLRSSRAYNYRTSVVARLAYSSIISVSFQRCLFKIASADTHACQQFNLLVQLRIRMCAHPVRSCSFQRGLHTLMI